MSKIRPWLGLYLWMNKERQEDFSTIWKSAELETKQRVAKGKKGAKIVQMPRSE